MKAIVVTYEHHAGIENVRTSVNTLQVNVENVYPETLSTNYERYERLKGCSMAPQNRRFCVILPQQ